MIFSLFISCPRGLEYLLEEELLSLGLKKARVNPHGVYGEGDLRTLYRLCLWSRLANRVHLLLFSGAASNQQGLYQLCRQYTWETVFQAHHTFAIEFHGASSQIRHALFGAQLVKDAIVDRFRSLTGIRPTVEKSTPHIRLEAYLKHETLTVSLDLTGYSLHQRGYRTQTGSAPLKENVAVGMLLRAKWPSLLSAGFGLQDPFCGSGTLVIEAAMMAANKAPGLLRTDQAFCHWVLHDPVLWSDIREEATQQQKKPTVMLAGSDIDPCLVEKAKANALSAGVLPWIDFQTNACTEARPVAKRGLWIANPPYGVRLGEEAKWISLYKTIGACLHSYYQGWQAAFITSNPVLAKATRLRAEKQYTLYNGPLACKLYKMTIDETNQLKGEDVSSPSLSASAAMFQNRLQKNYSHLQKWAKRNGIYCYRVYDADLPEYAYAIDIYNDYAVLQEYVAPVTIAPEKIMARSNEVLELAPKVLGFDPRHILVKQRRPQKGSEQYQKINQTRQTMVVQEGKALFNVNLYDYLDTGLFLDHRLLRLKFATLSSGTRFLNCFCYTATASVHAAMAGALTTNVDLSNTYLNWAKENFKLNRLRLSDHYFVQADGLAWLKTARDRFDVIFLDPPSFSNSKSMVGTLDIQRDHVELIQNAMMLLAPQGMLYFSTNARRFELASTIKENYTVVDISRQTIDLDFKRNHRIHQCFIIQHQHLR